MYEILRKLREEKGVSQTAVAKYLGIQRQTYNHYECGRRTPDNAVLLKLADFYGVTLDYLMGRFGSFDIDSLSEEARENITRGFFPYGVPDSLKNIATKKAPAEAEAAKEEKDIEKILAQAREQLMDAEGLMFDGEPASPEAIESILSAMKIGIAMAKEENKKYIPKKYRKD